MNKQDLYGYLVEGLCVFVILMCIGVVVYSLSVVGSCESNPIQFFLSYMDKEGVTCFCGEILS